MFKKTVQFEDLEGETVQDIFYFNFTKLEIMKMLELEKLEEKMQRLTKTEDAVEAYHIFEDLILRAYGEKSADNRNFVKTPEIRSRLESSPAFSEIIIEFVQNPTLGAEFIEKCLPPKMVAQAKAEGKLPEGEVAKLVAEAAERQENPETAVAPSPAAVEAAQTQEKKFEDYTREELLALSKEEFEALVPKDPSKMTQDQLLIAFQRKNQQ